MRYGVCRRRRILLDVDTGPTTLAVVSVVLGAGMGAAIGPTQLAGVAALPVRQSGLAAATISTTRQVGTALGVAVLGLIVATSAGAGPGTEGFADGFVRGLHISAAVTAAATLAAAVLLIPLARQKPAVRMQPADRPGALKSVCRALPCRSSGVVQVKQGAAASARQLSR
ncbi:hypothetical protein [Streptomyces lincolnensis]|uniref:hypothetical protein n=1 Tax=Streptomyces lincolnensis TaxID=1915 RepID=UPI0037D66C3A